MKKYFVFLCLLLNMQIHAQTIRVAAASNLRFILEEIKIKYLEHESEFSQLRYRSEHPAL